MQKNKSSKKPNDSSESTPKLPLTPSKSTGLGDTIERITKATGIDKAVKFIAGEDCGCDARREALNSLFRYRAPLCMTEQEFTWWQDFKTRNPQPIMHEDSEQIARIYSRLFQRAQIYRPCTCNPREWQRMINEVNKVYDTYL